MIAASYSDLLRLALPEIIVVARAGGAGGRPACYARCGDSGSVCGWGADRLPRLRAARLLVC